MVLFIFEAHTDDDGDDVDDWNKMYIITTWRKYNALKV